MSDDDCDLSEFLLFSKSARSKVRSLRCAQQSGTIAWSQEDLSVCQLHLPPSELPTVFRAECAMSFACACDAPPLPRSPIMQCRLVGQRRALMASQIKQRRKQRVQYQRMLASQILQQPAGNVVGPIFITPAPGAPGAQPISNVPSTTTTTPEINVAAISPLTSPLAATQLVSVWVLRLCTT